MSRTGPILELPRDCPPVIGMGAYLKAAVCLIEGRTARMSGEPGDLGTRRAIADYDRAVAELIGRAGVRVRVAAHDLHPDFHSSRAAASVCERTLAVQHHHAHIAAVAAENGHDGPLIGLALDGFGLGSDGGSWGGELLRVEGAGFLRLGHLALLAQPGGDIAAREPWRMAAAALHALGRGDEIAERFAGQRHAPMLGQVLRRGVNCPPTSSCGRLFDAACGLLGVRPVAEFEGQAPIELERLVRRPRAWEGGWTIGADGALDVLALLDRLSGLPAGAGADLFHGTLAAGLSAWAARAAEATGLSTVGLSGGCFLNKVLEGLLVASLERRGLRVLRHRLASPGDDSLALGQAWVAASAD